MVNNNDLYTLIKLDDDALRVELGNRFGLQEQKEILSTISEPLKLSFSQRMFAKAFKIDVQAQISRFIRVLKPLVERGEASVKDFNETKEREMEFYQNVINEITVK